MGLGRLGQPGIGLRKVEDLLSGVGIDLAIAGYLGVDGPEDSEAGLDPCLLKVFFGSHPGSVGGNGP